MVKRNDMVFLLSEQQTGKFHANQFFNTDDGHEQSPLSKQRRNQEVEGAYDPGISTTPPTVLHNSDSDSVEDMKDLEGIEGEPEGIIRVDYFSLDSQGKYLRTSGKGDVTEEGSVDSDNPRRGLGGFWSDSGSDGSEERKFGEFEGKNELGFVENAKGKVGSDGAEEILGRELDFVETVKIQLGFDGIEAEGDNSGKFWSDSSGIEGFEEEIEMGIGDNLNSGDGLMEGGDKTSDDGDVVMGTMKSGSEGEKRIMVWWKLPLELLKYCVFRISPVWTVYMAAAVMSFVILGRRYYRMMKKSRSLQLNVIMDDKMIEAAKVAIRETESMTIKPNHFDKALAGIRLSLSDEQLNKFTTWKESFQFR